MRYSENVNIVTREDYGRSNERSRYSFLDYRPCKCIAKGPCVRAATLDCNISLISCRKDYPDTGAYSPPALGFLATLTSPSLFAF